MVTAAGSLTAAAITRPATAGIMSVAADRHIAAGAITITALAIGTGPINRAVSAREDLEASHHDQKSKAAAGLRDRRRLSRMAARDTQRPGVTVAASREEKVSRT